MTRAWVIAFAALALMQAPVAQAQSAPRVINDPASLDWLYYGSDYTVKPLTGIPISGGAAVEVKVRRGSQPYAAGTNILLTSPIVKGRDYAVRFWARTIKSSASDGQGKIVVRFFRNEEPYNGFGDTTLTIGPEWKTYEVAARATMDIPANAGVGLQLASLSQTLQLGQAHVVEGSMTVTNNAVKAATSDPLPPQLQGKGELLNVPTNRQWVTYGKSQTSQATTTDVYTRQATLLTVSQAGKEPYDAGANAPIAGAIRKGDSLLVAVLARAKSAETLNGTGLVSLRLQSNKAPYEGWGEEAIHLAPGWKLFQWRTTATMDLPANGGEVAVHTGLAKQQVEIGPVYVIRLKGD
jgi:hypothetical protein